MIAVEAHPKLEIAAFVTTFAAPLGTPVPALELATLLERPPPALPEADVKTLVRDLLRVGGFKPAGRSKPASEYLQRAIPEGRLGSINAAVDACNAASFLGGLPISVVDLDRAAPPLAIRICPPGTSFVFNASGQVIDVGGLVCLWDAEGPCANAVKDAQRTKTSPETTRTLSVVWGTADLPGRAAALAGWYRQALEDGGASTTDAL